MKKEKTIAKWKVMKRSLHISMRNSCVRATRISLYKSNKMVINQNYSWPTTTTKMKNKNQNSNECCMLIHSWCDNDFLLCHFFLLSFPDRQSSFFGSVCGMCDLLTGKCVGTYIRNTDISEICRFSLRSILLHVRDYQFNRYELAVLYVFCLFLLGVSALIYFERWANSD